MGDVQPVSGFDLVCYLYPGWEPRIRPAAPRRAWMDEAPESFPYRCLPLGIANSHGWEILSPCGFEAVWNGGGAPDDVTVRADQGTTERDSPVALFGQGTFTLHIQGLFRTPPGWNLHVSGPPNSFKDGVAPLTGIIETDWSPYTFTMNWRLTRPDHRVRFEENEPIAHFFPVERNALEQFAPRFAPIDADPDLKTSFDAWSRSRNEFQENVRRHPPSRPAEKWQKLYYRGVTPEGRCPVADHQTKLQPAGFAEAAPAGRTVSAAARKEPQDALDPGAAGPWKLRKYEWLLGALARQRGLAAEGARIAYREAIEPAEFLEAFYAPGRPAVIGGLIEDWPARRLWSPPYLRARLAGREVEFQGGRGAANDFERYKDRFSRRLPFEQFLDMIEGRAGNDAYLTAYNSRLNATAMAPLHADIRPLPTLLSQSPGDPGGMFWIGPAETFTPLHHDLTNNLLVQVTGRKRVILADALALPRLYNDRHVFSEIADLVDPGLDLARHPLLEGLAVQDVELKPGDALFIPLGWWHQVTSLDFSVSLTFTNFLWNNDFFEGYPAQP